MTDLSEKSLEEALEKILSLGIPIRDNIIGIKYFYKDGKLVNWRFVRASEVFVNLGDEREFAAES